MVKSQLKASTATVAYKGNSSLFADMLAIADAKIEVDSGPIYLNLAHYDELCDLNTRIAKRGEASVRSICLEYWSEASADGKKHFDEYKKLADTEKRTAEQDGRFAVMGAQNNAINTAIDRAVKANSAIAWLRANDCTVEIEKLRGVTAKNAYALYAKRSTERDRVFLNANQLYKLETVRSTIDAKLDVVDMRTALKSQKGGTPNDDKAGGQAERIAPSKLAGVVKSLDNSLAAIAQDGGGFGVAKETNVDLRALWFLLDSTLTESEKALARDEAAKVAAEGKQAAKPAIVPNIVAAVKKAVTK